jgi:hypothetical protein
LILSPAGYDDLIPKSLDGYGMPHTTKSSLHSPGSRYTYKRKEVEIREERRGASETDKHHPFFLLVRLWKLVGSGGLKDSMHNPNRSASVEEKEPLLRNAGEEDGY